MYEKQPLTSANRRAALRHYDAYQRSTSYELYDVYGRCSSAKMKAWDYCKELMYKFNGYGLKIISANGYQFTAGFMFEEDGKTMFMYISKTHDIAVEVA